MNNNHYTEESGLKIHNTLHAFIVDELLPNSGVEETTFWQSFARIVADFSPRNKELLKKRDEIQVAIDHWHKHNDFDFHAYKNFLKSIDYLVEEGEDFTITTSNVDEEIAIQAGPQLVVPVMNARFALNACNARWGSLYDALYGTDVIAPQPGDENPGYNPARGEQVVAYGREFLDRYFPLTQGSFSAATGFVIEGLQLTVLLAGGRAQLMDATQWCGYSGSAEAPNAILLVNNGLHVEIQIDPDHPIGKTDAAGIKDIVLESALTTIMDCEDSVAAVDASDKTLVYRNWLGLMRGDLEETVHKGGREFVRRMNPDKTYTAPDGSALTLPGRSLMFVRNVGHLMTNPAVLTQNGEQVPEGIMDGVVTTVCAMHNLGGKAQLTNSRTGSIYVVKPKMHGPEEVAFTDALFAQIEHAFGLPANTLKVGIMDEERRTSVNLKECIRAAQSRVAFINTGFLDRTGDEIHTSMNAGAFAPKDQLKAMPWIQAYELNNVATGLACGLQGRAQIGKGMWAMPDNMAAMMQAKIAQPQAGANTAWVPSPTAATLHAMHYHAVNVAEVQTDLTSSKENYLDTILQIPLLAQGVTLSDQEIQRELENNAQGILGYVVRWIDMGVGCSKVPDITDTALMEDRATLRISSQHLSNWLFHGICTETQVLAVLKRMAAVVDKQNKSDPAYTPMCPDLENSVAFAAAKDLVFKGMTQPNGYTEPLLHAYRLQKKS